MARWAQGSVRFSRLGFGGVARLDPPRLRDARQTQATNGDTSLGGEDIDHTVCDYFISEFKKSQGIDLSKDKLAVQRLREAAETAKVELSSKVQTDVNLPFITADQTGPKHMNLQLTRSVSAQGTCTRHLGKIGCTMCREPLAPQRRKSALRARGAPMASTSSPTHVVEAVLSTAS